MIDGHHGRMYAGADATVVLLGDGEQLHHVAELLRRGDVVGGDLGDSFAVHVARHQVCGRQVIARLVELDDRRAVAGQ